MVVESLPLSELGAFFGAFQVIGSLVAAFLAYEVYKYDRLSKAWLAVVAALALLSIDGFLDLFLSLGTLSPAEGSLLTFFQTHLLHSFTLLLFIFGFWGMKYKFESFEIVEKHVEAKIKNFILGKPEKDVGGSFLSRKNRPRKISSSNVGSSKKIKSGKL
jgi:hypothetical protein